VVWHRYELALLQPLMGAVWVAKWSQAHHRVIRAPAARCGTAMNQHFSSL
jgi:hypothetical protein